MRSCGVRGLLFSKPRPSLFLAMLPHMRQRLPVKFLFQVWR
jgi:hypothetical protein